MIADGAFWGNGQPVLYNNCMRREYMKHRWLDEISLDQATSPDMRKQATFILQK